MNVAEKNKSPDEAACAGMRKSELSVPKSTVRSVLADSAMPSHAGQLWTCRGCQGESRSILEEDGEQLATAVLRGLAAGPPAPKLESHLGHTISHEGLHQGSTPDGAGGAGRGIGRQG